MMDFTNEDIKISGNVAEGLRSYTAVVLANNVARTPSALDDVVIVLTVSLTAVIGGTASVIVQVDNNGGGVFTTIATATNTNSLTATLGLLGGTSVTVQPLTFKIARTSQYRYVTTGTVEVVHHFQILN